MTQPTQDLTPYVPRLVLDWLREDPDGLHRRIDGTLAFVDISGFTAMSERLSSLGKAGAEEVTDVMNTTFGRLLGLAYAEGGTLLKLGGDALLLFYSGDAHAARAAKAASALRRELETIGRPQTSAGEVELQLHVGIHSGAFDFFLVGASHRELIVTGPEASLTVEMEAASEAGDVLLSPATAAALDPVLLGAEKGGGVLLVAEPDVAGALEPVPDVAGLDLERMVPVSVRRVVQSGTSESEHRQAAIAFVRFTGIDELLAASGADAVAEALDELVRGIQRATETHGVTFLETDVDVDGGRIILIAGAPETHGDDEERLLRALRMVVAAGTPLPLHIGVNRGRVFSGLVGTSFRRNFTVLGDTAALAARLMARAGANEIWASAAVIERSRTQFELRALEPFEVKGKSEPVQAYVVGEIAGTRAAAAGSERRLPFVDRQRERALLQASLGTVRLGFGTFVELVGEPGIGKSRLAEELQAQGEDMRVLGARCEQYESSTPYHPFRDFLRALLAVDLNGSAGGNTAALGERLDAIAPELKEWLPLLAIPLDVEVDSTPAVDELEPAFRRARLHGVVGSLLERLLPDATLMVFEDVHWMDEASADLLRHLGTQVPTKPWLACTTRRPVPGGFSALEGIPPVSALTLRLDPLPEQDALELAAAAGAEVGLHLHELQAITERAGGNPLFLQQLVAGGEEEEMPETVEAALASRIDRVDLADRALLRWASVLGTSFAGDVVAAVLEDDPTAVADSEAWDRLTEFVERDPDVPGGFRFRHALIRDAAYDGLPYRRRQELHARVAHVYEERYGEDATEYAELLSLHFLRGGLYDHAWSYSLLAGERAQSKWANVEAAEFYRRALEAEPYVPDLDGAEIARVWESYADVLQLTGELEEAATAFGHARERAPKGGPEQPALAIKEGLLREEMGRYDEAIEWYERGYAAIDEIADEEERTRTRLQVSMVHAQTRFRQGEFEDCIRRCREIVPQAEALGDLKSVAHAYYLLHVLYSMTGSPERTAFRGLALPIYEDLGDLVGQASVLNNMGIEAYYEGRWQEAVDLYESSRSFRERIGDVVKVAQLTNNIGEILSDQGKLAEAEEIFRECVKVGDAAGQRLISTVARSNLGRAAARAGRFDEAEELQTEALASFRDMGAMFIAETEGRLAELASLRGDRPARALELARGALEHVEAAGGMAPVQALLLRVSGIAQAQEGNVEAALESLEHSLRVALAADAAYEIALTLSIRGRIRQDPGDVRTAQELLNGLGVVSTPTVPLP